MPCNKSHSEKDYFKHLDNILSSAYNILLQTQFLLCFRNNIYSNCFFSEYSFFHHSHNFMILNGIPYPPPIPAKIIISNSKTPKIKINTIPTELFSKSSTIAFTSVNYYKAPNCIIILKLCLTNTYYFFKDTLYFFKALTVTETDKKAINKINNFRCSFKTFTKTSVIFSV